MADSHAVTQLARELIRLDTVNPPGNEGLAARFLEPHLRDAGFEVERIVHGGDRESLIARRGQGDAAPLVLSGHLDVVPVGTASWRTGPFDGHVDGGRLYGRGSCDMKGGVAAMVDAVTRLRDAHLRGPLLVVLSADEESGGVGARALAAHPWFPPSGRILIGEPTGLRPGIAEKGALWIELRFSGRAAHGAYPHEGASAIEGLLRAVPAAVASLGGLEHPVLGRSTANVAMLGGGSAPNMVADDAWARIDFRTVPGVDHGKLVEAVRRAADGSVPPGVAVGIQILSDHPPVETAADGPLATAVRRSLALAGVTDADPVGFSYYTDAAAFQPHGTYEIVLLGPGEPRVAHQADESVAVESLERAADAYEHVVRLLLGGAR